MKLEGSVRVSKRIRQHPIWQRPDYGWAFVDLLLLANDAPRTAIINGEAIPLKRGQLAWSLRALEKQWGKSGEWINHFMEFCRDHEMVNVDSNRRRTIITILNYAAYNPPVAVTDTVTETGSEPDTEAVTDTVTTTEQKGERGIGNRKGEAHPTEIPDDSAIRTFCENWPGDPARGIPAGIPEVWWSGWVANRLGDEKKWPRDWQRALLLAFRADFLNRHPKALANLTPPPHGNSGEISKKTGASVAQQRFELSRELEGITDRLEAAYETNVAPDSRDVQREREINQLLKNL